MSTSDFVLQHSTKIRFAVGAVKELGTELRMLGAEHVMVVCDEGIREIGIADKVVRILDDAALAVDVFSAISENPRDFECVAVATAVKECGADTIVGLGGGSAMDAAKAAAVLVTNGKKVQDWDAPMRLAKQPMTTVCVPTTSGTGSEVTFVSVITDDDRRCKMCIQDPALSPRVAVVDPELTLSLPPALTASTGVDALTHAIEAYTCRLAEPVTDALALAAMSLIASSLESAVANGDDIEARSSMMLGSVMAGMAFVNTDVGSVHCIAETLGGWYDIPHGVANAIFLADVLEFNYPADPVKHARVAAALGVDCSGMTAEDAAVQGIDEIRRLTRSVGIPVFSELARVDPSDFDDLARAAADHICTPSNARDIGYEEYLRLFDGAYAAKVSKA